MKKLFKVTALLLIAGAMMMTGCKTDPDETDKLPGTWTTAATYRTSFGDSTLTKSGSQFIYTKNSYSTTDDPGDPNSFNYTTFYVTDSEEAYYTGFKASAKSTPESSIYGLAFNMQYDYTNKVWSYYVLFMNSNSFKVVEVLNGGPNNGGTSKNIIDWKDWNSINLPKDGNEITVFTERDGSIVIRINDEENAGVIRNPVLKKGMLGVIGTVTNDEYTSKTEIKSTYEFKKFQY